MIKATVNGQTPVEVEFSKTPSSNGFQQKVNVNGQPVAWGTETLPSGSFSVLMGDQSFVAQVVKVDKEAKQVTVQIDNKLYEVGIEEPMDRLLTAMGIKDAMAKKVNDIKAPMPGLVLKVLVSAGQQIKKGDPVLILEAMKMENVFKATSDATVKEIKVTERTAVEKGEVLIVLE
ncbi:biotin carboxyl carrier protein [Chitinophaga skermanii]|uniref:Biotin carboxyl carrier protein n=1 Tax=Chitinophaga skermanii TaxID=331697 RepID=A0A327QIC1_9BACT|nr:biotin/lipoyl-containing protein [Chitinophaga skermanii]RAJ04319.1 biotin carboxyl carrier protein [Chitinophaga skermanii]